MQYVHFRWHTNYFLLPWKDISNHISRQSMLLISKGSTYHVRHYDVQLSIQPFTMEVDWPKIGCLMEVSIMFDICTYCIFTLYRRHDGWEGGISIQRSGMLVWFLFNKLWKFLILLFIYLFCYFLTPRVQRYSRGSTTYCFFLCSTVVVVLHMYIAI